MHIDFDDPKQFIPDALVILLQATWILEIDNLLHLGITAITGIFAIIRIYLFFKDRKEKKKLLKEKLLKEKESI